MKRAIILVLYLTLFLPVMTFANALLQQHTLPTVSISDKGELLLNNGQFNYHAWNSTELTGKIRVVQHIAGRSEAKEMNAPLIEMIKQAHFPHEKYQTTTIINTDDAILGTGPFVNSSIEESKQEFPWSQFIVDGDAKVKSAWGLRAKSSAIIILDKAGKIRFIHEGPLSDTQIKEVMGLLHQLVEG